MRKSVKKFTRLTLEKYLEELASAARDLQLAGRIMGIRSFGKASFFHIQDRRGRLQVYARKDRLGDDGYALFQTLDVGDIVGVWGHLFRTKTRELTLEAQGLRLLAKCCVPCRKNGTAWPMSRCVIACATST